MLREFTSDSERGLRFLNRAVRGGKKYDRVLFFEHPTLSVSPVINALELGRALAGSSGQIDVIAHSRGGLVVRWWLEAFGSSLRLAPANAGARRPGGLAAARHVAGGARQDPARHEPDRQRRHLCREDAGPASGSPTRSSGWRSKLIEVIVSVTGALAKTPLVDALDRARARTRRDSRRSTTTTRSTACASVRPPWIRPTTRSCPTSKPRIQAGNSGATSARTASPISPTSIVFPGDNDLVVDTGR